MSHQTIEKVKGRAVAVTSVGSHAVTISGRLPKIARIRDEPFECLSSPEDFIEELKREAIRADVFTFMQELSDCHPRFAYRLEWEGHAVLPVTTYEHWWKKQINDKARNMVRKAQKCGVDLRRVEFDDALVRGIVDIYNETPVRQGKPFWHFGKDSETIRKDHSTFLERSTFVGAFHGDELIGFIKFVRGRNVASLMQIISKIGHREKAPSNALIAKAVEMCAESGIPALHYGVWSTGGLGAFKTSHAFALRQIPRYFVPLNTTGRLSLGLNLHHKWRDRVPEPWIARITPLRNKWHQFTSGVMAPAKR